MATSTKKRKKAMKNVINNLVAKHARKFNKAAVHRDRKNDYRRNKKHRKSED